jgi:hypothetical protein
MDMNWVKEAYDKWIQGEDVNFEEASRNTIALT